MNCQLLQGDAAALPLGDKSVDLVLGSPPYCDARTYGIGAQRSCQEWVEWMLKVTAEAVRVSRGLVLWVCAGVTRDWCYWPACEGLLYEWWRQGGRCWRPAFWHRVGIPGSGGKQWLRADVEFVLAFTGCAGAIPWADNTANGHPPKWAPGGEMSYRNGEGKRLNQWGSVGSPRGMGAKTADGELKPRYRPSHLDVGPNRRANGTYKESTRTKAEKLALGAKGHTKRMSRPNRQGDGTRSEDGMETQVYLPPVLANPGNLVSIKVGGGQLGHDLAHENEAPFPLDLAKWFVRGWCPPGGTVLDPFLGSGTTMQAALELGRKGIGVDVRQSQVDLARRRLSEVQPELLFGQSEGAA